MQDQNTLEKITSYVFITAKPKEKSSIYFLLVMLGCYEHLALWSFLAECQ